MNPAVPLVLTREQVRSVDRHAMENFAMSGLVLMENAGRNAAMLLIQLGAQSPVVICCGKGNNAGDGFVMARHLENAGREVSVLLAIPANQLADDARANFEILKRAGLRIVEPPDDGIDALWRRELRMADWIVDALLGTGAQGIVREPFVTAINAINDSGRPVLAVDIPSGLDCDSGRPLGLCVHASHTATFVAHKPGFATNEGRLQTGTVHVLDIGVPRRLLAELLELSRTDCN